LRQRQIRSKLRGTVAAPTAHARVDVCEYPDSGEVSAVTGRHGPPGLRKIFRAEQTVDYYDREKK